MTKEDFTQFTAATVEEVIQLADRETGVTLSREICLKWLGRDTEPICSDVVAKIVERVYVGPDEIYPCVDIGVGDILADGRTLIIASIAGYSPRSFVANWTGRQGPYVLTYPDALRAKQP
ncbi:MAG TPA: hypothetical protein VLM38_07160 [Blastocatellia bacterium]|nr:hypothetical protein [Blastocatellia bacterium]